MKRRSTIRLFCGLLLVGVSACSGGATEESDLTVASASQPPLVTVSTSAAAPTTLAPVTTQVWTGSTRFNDSGDVTAFELEIGQLMAPPGASSLFPGIDASVCAPDDARDLVAPFKLTLTNANTTFSQKVSFALWAFNALEAEQGHDGPYLFIAAQYSASEKCVGLTRFTGLSGQSAYSCSSTQELLPSQSLICIGFVVLKGIKSEASPDGDLDTLANLYLIVDEWGGVDRGRRTVIDASVNTVDLRGDYGIPINALTP